MRGKTAEVSAAEYHISILRGLLHYHERMMLVLKAQCSDPVLGLTDSYSDALKEGIRCIGQVHGVTVNGKEAE